MSVGFIGLGNMGNYMARNLIRSGLSVVAFDLDANKLDNLKKFGAEVAKDPSEIASVCSNIITMLPSSPHVKEVFTANNGLLRTLNPGALCIDSSTIDQDVSMEIADLVESKGARYVDAPVSGGVLGAEKGTLTFMVGGDQSSFEKASDILKRMGKTILHCGKVGNGQAVKICNNMLLAIQMVGVAETMNLGIRMGLNAKILADVINTSSGRCWSSDTYNPVPHIIEDIPSSNHYEGGFGCSLMAKDLGLSQNAATSTRTPILLGSSAHQIYRLLAKIPQYEKRDFSVVYQFLKDHIR